MIARKHSERRSVLATHHDGARLTLPQITITVFYIIQPWATWLGVREPNLIRQTVSDVNYTILGKYQRRADVGDMIIAQAD